MVREALANLAINDVPSAPHSPWQNPYAEREIGNIRRELLDHAIVLAESHARVLLHEYQRYHNEVRPHLSLDKDSPLGRKVQGPGLGATVVSLPQVFGLQHMYERRIPGRTRAWARPPPSGRAGAVRRVCATGPPRSGDVKRTRYNLRIS